MRFLSRCRNELGEPPSLEAATGVGYTTIETKANFSRAISAQSGRVRAESRVVNVGRQIISAEGWVKASDGRMRAHGTSTLLVRNPPASGE